MKKLTNLLCTFLIFAAMLGGIAVLAFVRTDGVPLIIGVCVWAWGSGAFVLLVYSLWEVASAICDKINRRKME